MVSWWDSIRVDFEVSLFRLPSCCSGRFLFIFSEILCRRCGMRHLIRLRWLQSFFLWKLWERSWIIMFFRQVIIDINVIILLDVVEFDVRRAKESLFGSNIWRTAQKDSGTRRWNHRNWRVEWGQFFFWMALYFWSLIVMKCNLDREMLDVRLRWKPYSEGVKWFIIFGSRSLWTQIWWRLWSIYRLGRLSRSNVVWDLQEKVPCCRWWLKKVKKSVMWSWCLNEFCGFFFWRVKGYKDLEGKFMGSPPTPIGWCRDAD